MFSCGLLGDDSIVNMKERLKESFDKSGDGEYARCLSLLDTYSDKGKGKGFTKISDLYAELSCEGNKGNTNVISDARENIRIFYNRRKTLIACFENYHVLANKGLIIGCCPTSLIDIGLRCLYPYECGTYRLLPQFLADNGIVVSSAVTYHPFYSAPMLFLRNHFHYQVGTMQEDIVIENFSFDLGSRLRISSLCSSIESIKHLKLLVFFLESDFASVREYALSQCKELLRDNLADNSNDGFMLKTEPFTFMFICIEDFLKQKAEPYYFTKDGTCCLQQRFLFEERRMLRRYIPNDAKNISNIVELKANS